MGFTRCVLPARNVPDEPPAGIRARRRAQPRRGAGAARRLSRPRPKRPRVRRVAKSMKPRSTSVPMSSTRTRSPTSRPCSPRTTRPSTGGRNTRTQVPFGGGAGHDAVEALAHARREQQRRGRLLDLAFDLGRVVLLLRAVARELAQLVDAVGRGRPGERGLHEPLGHEVRVAAVRRRGVGVVLHRQAEVARRRLPRQLDAVLARAEQLDDGEREIREAQRDRRRAASAGRPGARARSAPPAASRRARRRARRSAPSARARAARAGSTGSPSRPGTARSRCWPRS